MEMENFREKVPLLKWELINPSLGQHENLWAAGKSLPFIQLGEKNNNNNKKMHLQHFLNILAIRRHSAHSECNTSEGNTGNAPLAFNYSHYQSVQSRECRGRPRHRTVSERATIESRVIYKSMYKYTFLCVCGPFSDFAFPLEQWENSPL